MKGKMKSLHGLYKTLGRDAFLAAAKVYSDQVQTTVEATLSVMESTWYDTEKKMTEAEKMIADYNKGYLTRESAEDLLRQEKLAETFADNINTVLRKVSFEQLDSSLQSPDKSYAEEVLKEMHNAFVKTYGTDYLDDGEYEFVGIPAVIQSRKTGKLSLGIVTLDLESSGEHWGTDFLTPYGIVSQGDPDTNVTLQEYIRDNFIPYDYWYTADVEGDIHVDFDDIPEDIADLIDAARGEQESEDFDYAIKM